MVVEVRINCRYYYYVVSDDVNEERVFLFPLYMKCVCVCFIVEKNVQASGGCTNKMEQRDRLLVCGYHTCDFIIRLFDDMLV